MINRLTNTKLTYNQLCQPGYNKIFNMEKKITNCPTFTICANTNVRPNRVPMSQIYFTPHCISTPLYVKQPANAKTACKCILNSVNTLSNICKCKISQ